MAQDIKTSLDKLKTALEGDKTALTGKEVSVPSGAKHSDIPALIEGIEAGSGEVVSPCLKRQPVLKDYQKNSILHVVFTDQKAPDSATTKDVSEYEDGSIVSWQTDDTLYISTQKEGVKVGIKYVNITEHIEGEGDVDFGSNLDMDYTYSIFGVLYYYEHCTYVDYEDPSCSWVVGAETNIKTIDFSNVDMSQAVDLSYLFSELTNLTEVDLTPIVGLEKGNVTSLRHFFSYCTSLKSINFGNLNTSNVTDMSGMFLNCSPDNWDLSKLDTRKVTDMGGMFNSCESANIDVSGFDTSSVLIMSAMFYYTTASMIDIRSFDFTSALNVKQMFYGAKAEYILMPVRSRYNGFKHVSNFYRTFGYCENLKSIDVSCFKTDTAEDPLTLNEMFYNCPKLEKVFVSGFRLVSTYGASAYGMFSYCETLSHIYVKYSYNNWTANSGINSSSSVFYYCYKLSGFKSSNTSGAYAKLITDGGYFEKAPSILDNETLTRQFTSSTRYTKLIVPKTYDAWGYDITMENSSEFRYTSSNDTIYVWNYDVSGGTVLMGRDCSRMFAGLTHLTSIDLTMADFSIVEDVREMFAGCTNLETVIFGDKADLTSLRYPIDGMFKDCPKLSVIKCAKAWNEDTEHVANAKDVFTGCVKLKGYSSSKTSGEYATVQPWGGYFETGGTPEPSPPPPEPT